MAAGRATLSGSSGSLIVTELRGFRGKFGETCARGGQQMAAGCATLSGSSGSLGISELQGFVGNWGKNALARESSI
jgi:hypothetical protein